MAEGRSDAVPGMHFHIGLQKTMERHRVEREAIEAEKENLRTEWENVCTDWETLRAEQEILRAYKNLIRTINENFCTEREDLRADNEALNAKNRLLQAEIEILCAENIRLKEATNISEGKGHFRRLFSKNKAKSQQKKAKKDSFWRRLFRRTKKATEEG